MNFIKKISFILIFSLLFFSNFNFVEASNCESKTMRGFAWSDGVGWISFDCKSANSSINYGVDVDKDGTLSGFAWSDKIGWIDFGYYSGEDRPKYNKTTHKLEGYVKALGGLDDLSDGWNGKISLAGTSSDGSSYSPIFNTTTFEFDEYAWGDSFIGWIDFKTNYGVVVMDPFYFRFTSNKGTDSNPVPYDDSVVLSWSTSGAVQCTSSNGGGTTWTDNINKSIGEPTAANETINSLKNDILFSLTCEDNIGNAITKDLNVVVAPPPPMLFLTVDDDNIPHNSSTVIKWNIENVENCVASSSSGTWDKSIDSSNGIHSDDTGNLTESSNWFKVKCDSDKPDYYPDGVEELIYVDVEKLIVEFYPETNPIKFNDKIKLFWKTEFSTSCEASGDINDFNGTKDHSEGLHFYETEKQEEEGVEYDVKLKCIGTASQELEKDLNIRVGKNPKYQEI